MPFRYFYNDTWTEKPPPAAEILKTLAPGHPRLLIDAETVDRLRRNIAADANAARWYQAIQAEAADILDQPPSKYEIPDGRRLLSVSRRVKERVRTLMFVDQVEGARQYVDRVWAEIATVVHFPDWNPAHFLDTAEMTHAVALAYDWFFECWTDEQRRAMREAIISHGLEPGMKVYRGKAEHRWDQNHNNWNQVCNGGLGMGALAIADEHPLIAAEILQEALASLPLAMDHYGPDGAGTEGVTYWDYGCRYNILFLTGLQTALGTDFGLARIEGFDLSGQYQLYMSGADDLSFNFADCGLAHLSTPMHFWMGRKFAMPQYSWFRYHALSHPDRSGNVLDLLWFDASGQDFDPSGLPLDKHFRGADCVSMRSSWSDPDALVVGIQAGANENLGGHRHLDLGSFILDALGERWVLDVGAEGETYQRHRNQREKWEFYRIRAEGHNLLVINPDEGPDQKLDARAKVTHFESTPARATAVVDLTDAYAGHVSIAHRTFEMVDRQYVTITDVLEEGWPIVDLWWFLHTRAEIEIDELLTTATLTQNGKKVIVKIEKGPARADFEIRDAVPLDSSPRPEQSANDGVRKLAIHLSNITQFKVTVSITPVRQG